MVIAAMLIIAQMTLAWMFSTSFKTVEQLRITIPIQWPPHLVTFENFVQGGAGEWPLDLRNTLILAVFVMVPTMISCTLAALRPLCA